MPIIATDAAMGDGQMVSWITDRLTQSKEGPRFIAAGIYRPIFRGTRPHNTLIYIREDRTAALSRWRPRRGNHTGYES